MNKRMYFEKMLEDIDNLTFEQSMAISYALNIVINTEKLLDLLDEQSNTEEVDKLKYKLRIML